MGIRRLPTASQSEDRKASLLKGIANLTPSDITRYKTTTLNTPPSARSARSHSSRRKTIESSTPKASRVSRNALPRVKEDIHPDSDPDGTPHWRQRYHLFIYLFCNIVLYCMGSLPLCLLCFLFIPFFPLSCGVVYCLYMYL